MKLKVHHASVAVERGDITEWEVDAIVKSGTPWFKKYGLTMAELHGVRTTEGWHARYGGGKAVGGSGSVDPNAVY